MIALSSWRLGGNIGVEYAEKDIYVLGVVSVMFEIGPENPALKCIFDRYEELKEAGKEIVVENIDFNVLLPDNKHYWTYKGSITTPPCAPVVKWHIMKDVLSVSEEQLTKLRLLWNMDKEPEGDNFRPIQSNPNLVYDCTQ